MAEEAEDEFVISEMMNSRPEECPAHRETKEQNENFIRIGMRFLLRHYLPPSRSEIESQNTGLAKSQP